MAFSYEVDLEFQFDDMNLWHLTEEVSIIQASLLLIGENPSKHANVENKSTAPFGFVAVKTAITNAILSKSMDVCPVYYQGHELYLDLNETKIGVEILKQWLIKRNFTKNFFFNVQSDQPEKHLNQNSEFYAPKMAASLNSWKYVTSNPEALIGHTPKQAIDKWLRLNANEYGLTKEDGSPNESAIQEISKIANWKPEGGASKTPVTKTKTTQVQKNISTSNLQ